MDEEESEPKGEVAWSSWLQSKPNLSLPAFYMQPVFVCLPVSWRSFIDYSNQINYLKLNSFVNFYLYFHLENIFMQVGKTYPPTQPHTYTREEAF